MRKFAVLIDADNSSHRNIEPILEEIAKYGIASVKRIYGDWSADRLQTWRDKLLPHAITPVQQFAYVTQKDATDMRLVIDAMDLLFAGDLDGFCIVSSDSDFTPLASRIRESGLLVYGFGEKKTVSSFVNACDKFVYVENLTDEAKPTPIAKDTNSETTSSTKLQSELKKEVNHSNKHPSSAYVSNNVDIDIPTLNLLYKAIKENSDEECWASLSAVGSYINNVKPDFDPRSYGSAKLSSLLKKLVKFETKIEGSHMFVRKFNFVPFIDLVQRYIEKLNEDNQNKLGWVKTTDLLTLINEHSNEYSILKHLSEYEINQKLLAIYKNSVEFKDDYRLIRITPE